MNDLSVCRQQFPSLYRKTESGEPLIYLDGPGGSQVPYSVIGAISEYYSHHNANTHGQFITSEESNQIITQSAFRRQSVFGFTRWRLYFVWPKYDHIELSAMCNLRLEFLVL